MPNRIIKESVCTSDSVDKLTWFEECVFYRLIVNCDDFGRLDARAAILRSRLFPLKSVTEKQINDALQSLRTAGIVDLYEVDGKPYLQLRTWDQHQTIRAKKSKFPAPCEHLQADEINCKQMQADASKCSRNPIQSESESESISESKEASPADSDAFAVYHFSPGLKDAVINWIAYKNEKRQGYKPTGLKALLTEIQNNADKHGEEAVISLISKCMASNWQGIMFDRLTIAEQPKKQRNGNVFLEMLKEERDG